MFESNPESEEGLVNKSRVIKGNTLSTMDKKLNLLNEKVDKLLNFQEDLTGKLQKVNEGIDDLGKGFQKLTVSPMPAANSGVKKGLKFEDGVSQVDTHSMCDEILKLVKATYQDTSRYKERIDKIEKMVDSVDKIVKFLGETFKNSKVVDFILKGGLPWRKRSPTEILQEAKDKPEEKGAKGKHAPANKGIQAEGKNSLEENKREKKLDECTGESEKVNSAGPVFSKVDSSVHVKERMAQPERTEMSGQTKSIKVCPKQKETGVKAAGQKSGLVSNLSSGTPSGSQNMDKTSPGLENLPQKHHSPKSKETEKNTSRLSAPTRETEPSTSKSGGEVVRTRLSINVQMTDGQEKTLKSKEGTTNSPGGKSVAPISSVSIDEGTKHLSEPCTAKQISKSSRTEPIQEQKGGRLSNKPSEKQAPRLQGLLAATSTEAEEKADSKCKTIPCLISIAKDTEKDPGSPAKSPKEKPKIMKDCEKEVKPESMELSSFTLRRRESRSNQGAEKPSENTPLLAASKAEEVIIDDSPPPPAPFEHRIVSIKQTDLTASYSVCHHEVLGGGRFGQVHKCTEKSTGLCLAAKIIKVKVAKEREEVKNEINIMNQLNHVNLIQLYDAFESKNNLTLIMEYVDGGELFDRIIDENYSLTELDAILFTKQICEGIHYLHQQYILHLDLKPENILCVNHTGNQIKIIDFGLARRYKPRDKLKVNFGTPEFLAPEVVNYDFVSFPTDMWSVGVIAYMLLSGLSPFLGETDTETMNYIVNCSWDFDAEAFEQVSEEAKEFVSRLLIKEKSGRTSAANCLKHEWLTDLPAKAKKSKVRLKSQLLLQRYMAQRKWKKHFYVVAAANRLRRFPSMSQSPA